MDGRAFLNTAARLVSSSAEEDWRTAVGRAYYGLMLEGRDRLQQWGFTLPPRDQVHAFVRMRFSFAADPDLKKIGRTLEQLAQLRNRADYELVTARWFVSSTPARTALIDATKALALLDHLSGDVARRAAAIAAIRKAWP